MINMCAVQGVWGVMVGQRGESFSEPQGVEHFAKDSSSQICGQTVGK